MDKQYYIDYFSFEREHWWYKARLNILSSIIKNNIKPNTPLKILNVGTATGATSIMLQQYGEVTSVEYDDDCREFTNAKTNLNVLPGDITQLKFDNNSFDLVCAFDVIEHVQQDALAASELQRVCKPNGHVFVTTPAFQFLWSEHDVINHHVKRYTASQLVKLFANKQIVFKSYFNSILFAPIAMVRVAMWPFQKLKSNNNATTLKSDFARFSGGFTNKVFYNIFMFEKHLMKYIKFPAGVSIALLVKNKA